MFLKSMFIEAFAAALVLLVIRVGDFQKFDIADFIFDLANIAI